MAVLQSSDSHCIILIKKKTGKIDKFKTMDQYKSHMLKLEAKNNGPLDPCDYEVVIGGLRYVQLIKGKKENRYDISNVGCDCSKASK
jgi:hypothetical protein